MWEGWTDAERSTIICDFEMARAGGRRFHGDSSTANCACWPWLPVLGCITAPRRWRAMNNNVQDDNALLDLERVALSIDQLIFACNAAGRLTDLVCHYSSVIDSVNAFTWTSQVRRAHVPHTCACVMTADRQAVTACGLQHEDHRHHISVKDISGVTVEHSTSRPCFVQSRRVVVISLTDGSPSLRVEGLREPCRFHSALASRLSGLASSTLDCQTALCAVLRQSRHDVITSNH